MDKLQDKVDKVMTESRNELKEVRDSVAELPGQRDKLRGDVINNIVKKTQEYGAYVDSALMHDSRIAKGKVGLYFECCNTRYNKYCSH